MKSWKPKEEHVSAVPIQVSVTRTDAERIRAAAKADGRSVAAWCRMAALRALEEQEAHART